MKTGEFGFVAVNTFFILSGFLITKSWFDNPNLSRFVVARVLRIFPALFAVAAFSAIIVGPLFSSWLLADYFADVRTWAYILLTGTMFEDTATLPGLFKENFEQHLVNAPLWTLKYELFSYALVGLLGSLALLINRERAFVVLGSIAMVYLVVQCLTDWREHSVLVDNTLRLWTCFLIGSVFYILRDKIALTVTPAILFAVMAISLRGTELFELASTIALAYAVMWFALVPSGSIRNFNSFGDYSYGLYIFAWPIQQATVQTIPGLEPHFVFVIVFPIALLLAVVSWHFLEKPCLGFRGRIINTIEGYKNRRVVRFNLLQSPNINSRGTPI